MPPGSRGQQVLGLSAVAVTSHYRHQGEKEEGGRGGSAAEASGGVTVTVTAVTARVRSGRKPTGHDRPGKGRSPEGGKQSPDPPPAPRPPAWALRPRLLGGPFTAFPETAPPPGARRPTLISPLSPRLGREDTLGKSQAQIGDKVPHAETARPAPADPPDALGWTAPSGLPSRVRGTGEAEDWAWWPGASAHAL